MPDILERIPVEVRDGEAERAFKNFARSAPTPPRPFSYLLIDEIQINLQNKTFCFRRQFT